MRLAGVAPIKRINSVQGVRARFRLPVQPAVEGDERDAEIAREVGLAKSG